MQFLIDFSGDKASSGGDITLVFSFVFQASTVKSTNLCFLIPPAWNVSVIHFENGLNKRSWLTVGKGKEAQDNNSLVSFAREN